MTSKQSLLKNTHLMEKYKIELSNQVYISLDIIYKHKKVYDQYSAINFVSGFF